MIRPDRSLPPIRIMRALHDCYRGGQFGAWGTVEPITYDALVANYREGTDAHRVLEAIQLTDIGNAAERLEAAAYFTKLAAIREAAKSGDHDRVRELAGIEREPT